MQPEGDYYEALCRDEGEDAQAFLSLLRELRQLLGEENVALLPPEAAKP